METKMIHLYVSKKNLNKQLKVRFPPPVPTITTSVTNWATERKKAMFQTI